MEGYVTLQWVAKNLLPHVYEMVKEKRLEVETVEGVMCLKQADFDKLDADLKATCSLAEAARQAGIPKGSVRFYIDRAKVLQTTVVLGRERVLLSSIEAARVYKAGHTERIRKSNRRSTKSHRIFSLKKRDFFSRLAKPLPKLEGLQVTFRRAGELLGLGRVTIGKLVKSGQLQKGHFRSITVESIGIYRQDQLQIPWIWELVEEIRRASEQNLELSDDDFLRLERQKRGLTYERRPRKPNSYAWEPVITRGPHNTSTRRRSGR